MDEKQKQQQLDDIEEILRVITHTLEVIAKKADPDFKAPPLPPRRIRS